jgi:hypothetical protein
MLAGLTLAAACGSSDDGSKSDSKSATTVSPTVAAPGVTTTTKPRIPFATGLAQMQATLAAAKGNACKLYNFSNDLQTVDNPSTPDESKAAADILAAYFMDIADVMQPDHPTQSTDLRNETNKFIAQAAKANYNLNDPSVNALNNDASFKQAFALFQQQNSSCATTTTTAGK